MELYQESRVLDMNTNVYFLYYLAQLFLRMRNFSDKRCRENQNTLFVFSNSFFFENRAVYEIMGINIMGADRPQVAIIACCKPKATNTHSEYVTFIAFPL